MKNTYIITAPVTDPAEVAGRLGAMTMAGCPAVKAIESAREKRWTFPSLRAAKRFARGIEGATVTRKEVAK